MMKTTIRFLILGTRLISAALLMAPLLATMMMALGQFDAGIPFRQWRLNPFVQPEGLPGTFVMVLVALVAIGMPLTAVVARRWQTGRARLGAMVVAGGLANGLLFSLLLGPNLELFLFTALCGAAAALAGGLVSFDKLRQPKFSFL